MLFTFHVCLVNLSVHCSLVVKCWERADLLALLYVMFCCVFVTFPCGILGQLWCLIVSILDLCLLSYFELNLIVSCNMLDRLVDPLRLGFVSTFVKRKGLFKLTLFLYRHFKHTGHLHNKVSNQPVENIIYYPNSYI